MEEVFWANKSKLKRSVWSWSRITKFLPWKFSFALRSKTNVVSTKMIKFVRNIAKYCNLSFTYDSYASSSTGNWKTSATTVWFSNFTNILPTVLRLKSFLSLVITEDYQQWWTATKQKLYFSLSPYCHNLSNSCWHISVFQKISLQPKRNGNVIKIWWTSITRYWSNISL